MNEIKYSCNKHEINYLDASIQDIEELNLKRSVCSVCQ